VAGKHRCCSLLPVNHRHNTIHDRPGFFQGIDPVQGRTTGSGDILDEEDLPATDIADDNILLAMPLLRRPDDRIGFFSRKGCCNRKGDPPDRNAGDNLEFLRAGNLCCDCR